MVSDGVTVCIQYIDKFNPDKSSNPFSYFLQCCFYAFIRRIQLEKKQQYTKAAIIDNMGVVFDDLLKDIQDEDEDYHNHLIDTMKTQQNEDLKRLFEGKKEKAAKKRASKNTQTVFIEDVPSE
jgi:Mg2+ and Co2+ transporter CorA